MIVWARALIASRRFGCQIIAPDWAQLRLGPVLRGDPRQRFYRHEFTNRGYVAGFRKFGLLVWARRLGEDKIACPDELLVDEHRRPLIVEFSGLREYFAPLIPHRLMLASELLRIAAPDAVRTSSECAGPFIVAHVRRGDLTRQSIPPGQIIQFTSLDWFIQAVRALRAHRRWKSMQIKVVSDGSRDELQSLLALANCELASTDSAIGDILLMSRATTLLASGYSTFSMWGSFLGGMPTLYAPGKMQQSLFETGADIFEGEWCPGEPLPDALR